MRIHLAYVAAGLSVGRSELSALCHQKVFHLFLIPSKRKIGMLCRVALAVANSVSFGCFCTAFWKSTKTKSGKELFLIKHVVSPSVTVFRAHEAGRFRVSSVSQFSCCSYLPFSYETVASILNTSGSTLAGQPQPSIKQPCHLINNELQPCLHEVDPEILCSSEADNDPPIPIDVDILPPTDFSDTAESQATAEEKVSETQKKECSSLNEAHNLVAILRRAASEQEKEREGNREREEREKVENIKRAEKQVRDRKEREEEAKKEKHRLEREKEEARKRLEKGRKEMRMSEREGIKEGKEERNGVDETRQGNEHKEKRETEPETKQQRKDVNEEVKKKEKKGKGKEDNHGETPQWRTEALPVLALEKVNQKVDSSQQNNCPPLREVELEDIAYDERSQGNNEESGFSSDPKLANTIISNAEVLTSPADSAPAAKTKTSKAEDYVCIVKKTMDDPGFKSLKKGKSYLKHGAIPEWLREDDVEEISYERGQEDLGSIWLAELYMEGEAG